MATFRRLRPTARFGRYAGDEKDLQADVLFASIQTLGRISHLRNFPADAFDYIVVDEFHHAAARTYRTLIEHFTPKFLLGLTATPERTDGGDLLALCQENLVYRCDMRVSHDKSHLIVLDYIGNHRVFLTKARALLQAGDGDRSLALALDRVRRHEMQFPPGCEVTYDLKALDLLEGLLRASKDADALEAFYVDFRLRHGERPTATEVLHAGFNPRATGHGGWFSFIEHMGDLGAAEKSVHQRHGAFLDSVAGTPMSRSYKMLLLEAMLLRDSLPGRMHRSASHLACDLNQRKPCGRQPVC